MDLNPTGPKSAVHAAIASSDVLTKESTGYLISETHLNRIKPLFAVPIAWKVVAEILSSPYWRRKCVVQEASRSNHDRPRTISSSERSSEHQS